MPLPCVQPVKGTRHLLRPAGGFPMADDVSLLDRIVIASPCMAAWAEMKGDERVRFCDLCKLNVYNLSAMTRPEAERLIAEKEGCLCATFYRRQDGTILTRDCPVGL